ncbi:MAG: type I restriction enzyme HsdR N-terminal domain-containing protein [Bacteroidota bacterium]
MFAPLNLPFAELKLSKKDDKICVWCIVRKKNLILTPEEWVRQHLLHYLVFHKKIPLSLIASEIEIKANKQVRRCDIVVFNLEKLPHILIECKAPEIKLNQKVVQQIIHYNNQLKVPIIAISNGLQHEIIEINYETGEFRKLEDFF